MEPTTEQIEAYKEMAKASPTSMKAMIEENLKATCDKYAGNEDRFESCMKYLNNCAQEILDGKPGDVPDEVCYRICRDYFNDELWHVEEVEARTKAAEIEAKKQEAEFNRKKAEKGVKDAKKKLAKAKKDERQANKDKAAFISGEIARKQKELNEQKADAEEKKEPGVNECERCGLESLDIEEGLSPACHALLNPSDVGEDAEGTAPAPVAELTAVPEPKKDFKPEPGHISFLDMLET